jgi:hypothetical protein
LIGLPRIADELYESARVLRLFALGGRPVVRPERLSALAALSADEVQQRLAGPGGLISS